VSDDIKTKIFDVLFIKSSSGYSVAIFKKDFFKKLFDGFNYSFDTLKRRYSYPLTIIQSDDRILLKYPNQRSANKIKFYGIDDGDVNRILKSGDIIYK